MYQLFQYLYKYLSKVRTLWLALFCLGTILLWSQVSLFSESYAKTQSSQFPSEIAAQSVTKMKVKCSEVPYGKSTDRNQKKAQLAALPLNELLVELDLPHFVSPPNPVEATQVGIGLFVEEISELSASDNSYAMEGFLDLIWCDSRLNFEPKQAGWQKEIFLEKDAEKKLERIWWPDLHFINEITPRQIENEELIIEPDGTIEYQERFFITLASEFEMRRFPFDTQKLLLELESFAWSSDYLVFQVEEDFIGFSSEFSIPEWKIINIEEHLETKRGLRDKNDFSQLVAEITVQRDPGSYITKIIIPMITIVGISWSVFWMIGDGLADRLGVSFTGVLTIVAYQFIVSDILPNHIYNTFLDGLILLSFVMLVLTIIENITVNMLCLQGKETSANSIDHFCRWLFPVAYLVFLSILALIYLL
ncbi:hypothetical protein [Spirulina sp. 06S082]|uniref:hypothetical protein n=1 Tax=Spirulina sp. 06S082 TaxID=3110248 RepID=UPI002B20E2A8|nr:hypothetical protein [Spirulina sp. 06S082]MEA5469614.1 hypothetical protein [Spirulina sp. 06S082]